jgi:hypothetical protein
MIEQIEQIEQAGSQAPMRTTGGKAHSKRRTLVQRDTSGNAMPVPTEDTQHDSMYLSEVQIGTSKPGTSPQIMYLDFDTGSADCWVRASP